MAAILASDSPHRLVSRGPRCEKRPIVERNDSLEFEPLDQYQQRRQNLKDIEALGHPAYPRKFAWTHTPKEILEKYAGSAVEELESSPVTVSVPGRIVALRPHGKAAFAHIAGDGARLQIYVRQDIVGEEAYKLFKLMDLGDFVGVTGHLFRTKTNELSVKVDKLELLTKSLRPLPEKYHGLADVELRYRRRYLDLIMNQGSRETLRRRSRIVAAMRSHLVERGYLEVETPMLHTIPGGASAKPFVTHHNALDIDLYLRIAPELHLKRLLVGGLADKVFEINRCFRNEGISPRHNPEFTSLELYEAYVDYTAMMRLTEELVTAVAETVLGTLRIDYGGTVIDLSPPWPRHSMAELVHAATGVDFLAFEDVEVARRAAEGLGAAVMGGENWGQVLEAAFAARVEDTLIQPIHVTGFPRDISPLAQADRTDPRLAERFETYIYGWEVANAFSELTDPQDQQARFEAQMRARAAGDEEAQPLDEDYVTALEYGLPPCGGLGIGIDRLVMLLTDSPSIRDVIAFPTLRPR